MLTNRHAIGKNGTYGEQRRSQCCEFAFHLTNSPVPFPYLSSSATAASEIDSISAMEVRPARIISTPFWSMGR